MTKGDSVSMQAVYGFKDRGSCVAAGKASEPLVSGSFKELRYVCLEQKR
jgi:hypothetical protein